MCREIENVRFLRIFLSLVREKKAAGARKNLREAFSSEERKKEGSK